MTQTAKLREVPLGLAQKGGRYLKEIMEGVLAFPAAKSPFQYGVPMSGPASEKTVFSKTTVTRHVCRSVWKICHALGHWHAGHDIFKGKASCGGRKEPSTGDDVKVRFSVRVVTQGDAHFWGGSERFSFIKLQFKESKFGEEGEGVAMDKARVSTREPQPPDGGRGGNDVARPLLLRGHLEVRN